MFKSFIQFRQLPILSILFLSFAIQFYQLGARTFHGDEFNSLLEIGALGRNVNGYFYFVLLQPWLSLGTSEFWLRCPSAFFVVATVAATYRFCKILMGRQVGIIASILMATSPFLVGYGQLVRFYALFLLVSTLTYLAFVLYIKHPSNWRLGVLIFSNLVLLGCHLFGLLVVASELIAVFYSTPKLTTRTKQIIAATLFTTAVLLLIPFQSREFFYGWVSRITNPYGDPSYTFGRGVTIANLAKIPLTFFFIGLGESTYPGLILFVIPSLVFLGCVAGLGIYKLLRESILSVGLVVSLFLFPVVLYLVFDPLSPPGLEGAAPRYLIFLLPLFFLLLATGAAFSRFRRPMVLLLILINLGAIFLYWQQDWSYTDDLINWRAVTAWLTPLVNQDTVIITDGRAYASANYYFPPTWTKMTQGGVTSPSVMREQLNNPERIVMISDNFHADNRAQTGELIDQLETNYNQSAAWGRYPMFVYVFDRKNQSGGYPIDARTGRINLPAEIYGLEFQDLTLPIHIQTDRGPQLLTSAFALPTFDQRTSRIIPLAQPQSGRQLTLFSNVTASGQQPIGTEIAKMTVDFNDGSTQIIPLRLGYETNAWNKACVLNNCSPAFEWQKRVALVGTERYPESYDQFNAAIFQSAFPLQSSSPIRQIRIDRSPSAGKFYVWGLSLAN